MWKLYQSLFMKAIPYISDMWLQGIKWKLNYIDNKADKADHEKNEGHDLCGSMLTVIVIIS